MGETFKQRLARGRGGIGVWIETYDPIAAEILATAGYDCAMIDLEHGPGSYRDAQLVMQAMRGTACVPLLRVPVSNRVEIKRALDIGAQGVMCPSVSTVAEAEECAAACRYPARPGQGHRGVRGMAPTIVRAADFGRDWQAYVERSDREVLTIVQIETAEGVENAAAIAAVAGVDMLFIGPMDLSGDLGQAGNPDHPTVQAAIARVETAARGAGKLLGAVPTGAHTAGSLLARGYNLVIPDVDTLLLREGARASLAALRN
jgi:2-keto-3-deoxy-L-rhamnonate aldolase RhmA